ncbi:hypothetical protein KY290_021432 [Solanum tuberosum]|uniref:Uncharacterized protein n=1 Tax=Solanum tuberosum TaxID=4113 RepID=A0ABQ7V1I7_SOLTU|nr:hypothetical protein KY285_020346 [Solanum tuberosum]KAH0757939.1 hypothetical protein KY290_021432 [Solanum tuberosum]
MTEALSLVGVIWWRCWIEGAGRSKNGLVPRASSSLVCSISSDLELILGCCSPVVFSGGFGFKFTDGALVFCWFLELEDWLKPKTPVKKRRRKRERGRGRGLVASWVCFAPIHRSLKLLARAPGCSEQGKSRRSLAISPVGPWWFAGEAVVSGLVHWKKNRKMGEM